MRKVCIEFILLFVVMSAPANATPSETAATAASSARESHAPAPVPDYTPANPPPTDRSPRGWKGQDRFDISNIDGLKEVYDAGEPIVFYVEGRSDILEVEPTNGFYVISGLNDHLKNIGYIASVEYDPVRHAWQVKVTAPKDNTQNYELSVTLICGGKETPCITTYGLEAKVGKTLPVQVQRSTTDQ